MNDFHFYKNAYNKEETMLYIKRYLKEVCDLELSLEKSESSAYYVPDSMYGPCIYLPEGFKIQEKWDDLALKTAENIKKKLEKGKYI